jgi:saccharopine dehydrogenase-like NADP-dependent oxidoreductase
VAEQFALLQANCDRQHAIAALDADDLDAAEQCLLSIDASLAAMPCSTAINTERHAIQQRRSMLHNNRNRSSKTLRREALRSSVNVWQQREERPD